MNKEENMSSNKNKSNDKKEDQKLWIVLIMRLII